MIDSNKEIQKAIQNKNKPESKHAKRVEKEKQSSLPFLPGVSPALIMVLETVQWYW